MFHLCIIYGETHILFDISLQNVIAVPSQHSKPHSVIIGNMYARGQPCCVHAGKNASGKHFNRLMVGGDVGIFRMVSIYYREMISAECTFSVCLGHVAALG